MKVTALVIGRRRSRTTPLRTAPLSWKVGEKAEVFWAHFINEGALHKIIVWHNSRLTVFCELGQDICISNQLFVAIMARVSRNRTDVFIVFLVVDFHLKHTNECPDHSNLQDHSQSVLTLFPTGMVHHLECKYSEKSR